MTGLAVVAGLAFPAWVFLALLRGGFWRGRENLPEAPAPSVWPAVTAVVPARDEAATIGRTVTSILGQDYPGKLALVVVDDASTDGTAEIARAAARGDERLKVTGAAPLPEGWAGKVWAMHQGVQVVAEKTSAAEFIWFTDADIGHHARQLRDLVALAEARGLDLVSLLVRLRCRTVPEKFLIPAFVFFFRKLYPFAWVNDSARATAAAAGGCMLVRRRALEDAGGLAAIKAAIIDDCALARAIKARGAIWLGLAGTTESLRGYGALGGIWRMVARSAFHQLRYSWSLLAGTVLGMAVLYGVPPAALFLGLASGDVPAVVLGGAGWVLMAGLYRPSLAYFGRPAWEAMLLPVAAMMYALMTLDSARRHRLGRGGAWKGRTYGGDGRGHG